MQYSNLFVVAMGICTVFVVLILIIALCSLLSLIFRNSKTEERSNDHKPCGTNRRHCSSRGGIQRYRRFRAPHPVHQKNLTIKRKGEKNEEISCECEWLPL